MQISRFGPLSLSLPSQITSRVSLLFCIHITIHSCTFYRPIFIFAGRMSVGDPFFAAAGEVGRMPHHKKKHSPNFMLLISLYIFINLVPFSSRSRWSLGIRKVFLHLSFPVKNLAGVWWTHCRVGSYKFCVIIRN